jgi:hypothetical protein
MTTITDFRSMARLGPAAVATSARGATEPPLLPIAYCLLFIQPAVELGVGVVHAEG